MCPGGGGGEEGECEGGATIKSPQVHLPRNLKIRPPSPPPVSSLSILPHPSLSESTGDLGSS